MAVLSSFSVRRPWAAFAAITALAAVALLANGPAGAQSRATLGASGAGQDESVAKIGSTPVTRGELEAFVAPQLMTLRQQQQEVLEKGLDRYLSDEVVKREAKAKGVSVDKLLQQEVASKVQAPTDKDVDAFYEQNKDRISAPKDQIADRIKEYLTQQRQAQVFTEYTDALKKKYGVAVLLKPLRVAVDSPKEPSRGAADAPVTVVEFGDFQCPYCAGLEPTLEKVLKDYTGKVRLEFRQFPLESIHPHAFKAAEASMCAREQNKFWELHDTMYGNQDKLTVDDLKAAAGKLGMDAKQFDKCLDSGKYDAAIRADQDAGEKAGVSGTPALFVNGRPVPGGAVGYDVLAKIIDDELARNEAGPKAP